MNIIQLNADIGDTIENISKDDPGIFKVTKIEITGEHIVYSGDPIEGNNGKSIIPHVINTNYKKTWRVDKPKTEEEKRKKEEKNFKAIFGFMNMPF